MVTMAPSNNVTAATFGGLGAVMIVHICQANGIVIPPDVADSLPFACSIAIAHIWDMVTGGNEKPQSVQQNPCAQMQKPPTSS